MRFTRGEVTVEEQYTEGLAKASSRKQRKDAHLPAGGGTGKVKHPPDWISGNCTSKRHKICTSLACSCVCHAVEEFGDLQ